MRAFLKKITRPTKRIVKDFLKAQGYQISKSTAVERRYMGRPWPDLIWRDPSNFATIYSKNRALLSSIPQWISEEDLRTSLWDYGVPSVCLTSWNNLGFGALADVDMDLTVVDLLAFVGSYLSDLRYLEIGIGVGKNFLQICKQFPDAISVGLDVEEINPVLRSQFTSPALEWQSDTPYLVDTFSGQRREKRASLTRLSKTVSYLSADLFRDDTWARLEGQTFNLIFSDAVHSPDAVRAELQFLLRHELIDKARFAMFWDDLFGEMQSAFMANARDLCKMFNLGDDAIRLFRLHGSYGDERPVGLFCSWLP
jgi:hypothetical protein